MAGSGSVPGGFDRNGLAWVPIWTPWIGILEDPFGMPSYVFLDGIPFLSGFALAVDVGLQLEVAQLPLQLAITLQTVRIQAGFADGAAGFLLVRAIAKSASPGQLGDVGEGSIDALGIGPQLQLAKSGKI